MSRISPIIRGAVLAISMAAGLSMVAASELTHTVQPGESVSAIAKKHLGDYEHADLLLAYNGRDGATIHAGEKLRVPFCDVHVVGPGDSWSAMTQRYLGRPSAYPTVAALNGLSTDSALQVGQRIVMPVVLTTTLRPGDSLAALAERYLGDTQWAGALQRFNDIDDPRRLSVGQSVQVPLMHLRRKNGTTSSPPAERAADTEPPAPAPQSPAPTSQSAAPARPRFTKALALAATALRQGDFEDALDLLEPLVPRVQANGLDRERAALASLLVEVYVAFDRTDAACAAHRIRPGGDTEPGPDRVSPKIRAVLSSCARS